MAPPTNETLHSQSHFWPHHEASLHINHSYPLTLSRRVSVFHWGQCIIGQYYILALLLINGIKKTSDLNWRQCFLHQIGFLISMSAVFKQNLFTVIITVILVFQMFPKYLRKKKLPAAYLGLRNDGSIGILSPKCDRPQTTHIYCKRLQMRKSWMATIKVCLYFNPTWVAFKIWFVIDRI